MRMLIAFLACVVLSPLPHADAQRRVDDDRAVRHVIAAASAALNARDWTAAAGVFADDGDVILPGRPRVSGRAAIRDFWQHAWAGAPAQRQIALTVRALRFVEKDVAIADCTAEFSTGEPARDRATYVLVRRGGKWQVAALRVMQAEGA